MHFPSYFGGNWDAFSDCVNDLSWLAAKDILIAHRDLPSADNPTDQAIYLDTLANAVRGWKDDAIRDFKVVFPSQGKRMR